MDEEDDDDDHGDCHDVGSNVLGDGGNDVIFRRAAV
jgi:hypothetical protein